MRTASHAYQVKVLRQWTRNTQRTNQQRAANRQRYHDLQALRVAGEYPSEELRQEALGLLVEGIDLLPLPTLSDVKRPVGA